METLPEINLNTAKSSAKKATSSLRSAGNLVAKNAEQTKLITVTLPRAYAQLGKAVFKDGSRRDECGELFNAVDNLLAALSVLTLKRVDDTWKSRNETIRGWQESAVADSPFPYGGSDASTGSLRPSCSWGSCSLSGR